MKKNKKEEIQEKNKEEKKKVEIQKDEHQDLYASDCEILEVFKNKVLVKVSDNESLVASKIGKIKKGEKVDIYKKPFLDRADEILIYLSPLYYLFLGIVFGFLFPKDTYATYHYLLIVGLTFVGFIQLFLIRYRLKKMPKTRFVALDKSILHK